MEQILYILLFGLVAGIWGSALRFGIQHRRRDAIASLIVAAVGGVVCGAFGSEMHMELPGQLTAIGLAVAIVLAGSRLHRLSVLRSIASAPSVREFALANFDWLDTDGDSLITRADLHRLLYGERRPLSEAERKMVKLIDWELCHIGHVIDSMVVVSPMSGAAGHIDTFGASREDLDSYPRRIEEHYIREFGVRPA